MKIQLELEFLGKNQLFLHQQLGEGTLADGRRCSLQLTNGGIMFQVWKEHESKTFRLSYENISKAIAEAVPVMEKEGC